MPAYKPAYLRLSSGMINTSFIIRILTYPNMYEIQLQTCVGLNKNVIQIDQKQNPDDYKIIDQYVRCGEINTPSSIFCF